MYETLAILAAFVFLYSLTSGGLEKTPVNGAIVFVAFGLAFGPLGLASIVFAVIVLDMHLPGGGTISMTAVCTIVLSVILHGLSAHPLVAALGASLRRSQGEEAVK